MTKIDVVDNIINIQTQVVFPGKDELRAHRPHPQAMDHQTRDS